VLQGVPPVIRLHVGLSEVRLPDSVVEPAVVIGVVPNTLVPTVNETAPAIARKTATQSLFLIIRSFGTRTANCGADGPRVY
jgi:hypothetical protein